MFLFLQFFFWMLLSIRLFFFLFHSKWNSKKLRWKRNYDFERKKKKKHINQSKMSKKKNEWNERRKKRYNSKKKNQVIISATGKFCSIKIKQSLSDCLFYCYNRASLISSLILSAPVYYTYVLVEIQSTRHVTAAQIAPASIPRRTKKECILLLLHQLLYLHFGGHLTKPTKKKETRKHKNRYQRFDIDITRRTQCDII